MFVTLELIITFYFRDKSKTFYVKFGSSFHVESSETEQIIPVRAIDHFLYDPDKFGYVTHDIAVLELEYPVIIDNFTRPVCLGTSDTLQRAMSQSNPECYVTGFGVSENVFNGTGFSFIFEYFNMINEPSV